MRAAHTEYDHIVVGAGSAGCAVARRLIDAGRSVLLIETGGRDDNPAIHDPGRLWELWNSPQDHAFTTEPQRHANGAQVFWPRGKVLGGSSALNGMIYVRGHRSDYDDWAMRYGATGWSYDEVLPYFKRSEDFEDGPSAYHGAGGPLPVTRNHSPNPVTSAFMAACEQYGIPYNDDCNAEEILGVNLIHRTIRDGRRVSAWTAFVQPVLDNPLLTVRTGALVTRVLVAGGRAVGVEVFHEGHTDTVRCSGDVVLSAGTIGSAQLLLLSGIGPADELRALGIGVTADLPGVGGNLHDHTLTPVVWESARAVPEGTANKLEAHYFAKTDPALPAPDLQPLMSHVPLPVSGQTVPEEGHGYSVLAGTIRPLSRGRLWLRSADPTQAPALDPNHFAEPGDLTAMVEAVKQVREIGAQRALGDWRSKEIAPGPGIHTDAEIAAYIKRNLLSYHHQVGTCRMGTGSAAVVDPRLAVHGLTGLRVADASVMPAVTSGNTHAPAVMIGERCAGFVLDPQEFDAQR
ncbi:GMC family oxidoreductase [Streptomyces canus]|uniref:GMC family oxidoreductase n=1 Tax=Streptomyces canus TaxID=58343 RepID=UPI003865C4CE|nr:GMC family oxidoreductase N-terminal domain-containing protein [Streptomyces canus]